MTGMESIEISIWSLVLRAGPVVKLVMICLTAASVYCWAVIFAKARSFRTAERENENFLHLFWNSKSFDDIFSKSESLHTAPLANVFNTGFKELQKLSLGSRKTTDGARPEVENLERALLKSSAHEAGVLEKYLSWLATTASAAPFVGLFGTVWGIMNSFQKIGVTQSANIAVVAPGISEALIATAIGLAAAIPATVAYNHFVNRIKKMTNEMEIFSQDFLNIVQRGLMMGHKQ